jgi:hypothetical protein
MRATIGIGLLTPLFLDLGFAQGNSATPGSIRRNAFTKGTNGEPAVLPSVLIVIRGPISRATELHAKGAFVIASPPGISQIEANTPRLYPTLAVEVGASTSSTIPVEKNVAAVSSTTSTRLTRLRAMHSAFSRKMLHHA